MSSKSSVVLVAILLAGCGSITATKAPIAAGETICIVRNSAVREAFLEAYDRHIKTKGYTTKIVEQPVGCNITSTYAAEYGFHFAPYLSTAQLTISLSGKEVGKAEYDVAWGSPGKYGSIDRRIQSMVNQLLP